MLIERIVVGPFQENCYIVACTASKDAVVLDPGDQPEKILKKLEGLSVKALLHTHAHIDHIGCTRALQECLAKKGQHPLIGLHRADEPLYEGMQMQAQLFGLDYENPPKVDTYLEDGQILEIGQLKIQVIHTPGHSPGGICLHIKDESAPDEPAVLFSGDTLFQGSIGRTDMWGGNSDQLLKAIRERILTLPEETAIYSGHGPRTTVGDEKRTNPFI